MQAYACRMKLPRRILLALAPLALGVALALPAATATAARAAPHHAAAAAVPAVIPPPPTANSHSAAFRAEMDCSDGTIKYGGWHTGTGTTSATGECNSGSSGSSGWEDY